VVWDKSIEARYKKPAKSSINGEFIFSKDEIAGIKQLVIEKNEAEIIKTMNLIDEKQNIIATFNKTHYIADKCFIKKIKKHKVKSYDK